MISISTYRGAGDRPGDDIVSPLIGSVACALARGRSEMDARAHNMSTVTLTTWYRPMVRLGHTVRVMDVAGVRWIGVISGISHRISDSSILMTLTITKPRT